MAQERNLDAQSRSCCLGRSDPPMFAIQLLWRRRAFQSLTGARARHSSACARHRLLFEHHPTKLCSPARDGQQNLPSALNLASHPCRFSVERQSEWDADGDMKMLIAFLTRRKCPPIARHIAPLECRDARRGDRRWSLTRPCAFCGANASKPRSHNGFSITTNPATIAALLRMMNRYVGNLPPMLGAR
jgi:hypothetical protein